MAVENESISVMKESQSWIVDRSKSSSKWSSLHLLLVGREQAASEAGSRRGEWERISTKPAWAFDSSVSPSAGWTGEDEAVVQEYLVLGMGGMHTHDSLVEAGFAVRAALADRPSLSRGVF